MNKMIDNFLNGNLTDARQQAKKFSLVTIHKYLVEELGWNTYKASATARYLKGQGTFQAACDAQ